MRVVPLALHCPLRHDLVDAREIVTRELHVDCTDRFREPVAAPGAHQRHDVLAASQHPGDGELRDGDALLARDDRKRIDEREIVREILALKARKPAPGLSGIGRGTRS